MVDGRTLVSGGTSVSGGTLKKGGEEKARGKYNKMAILFMLKIAVKIPLLKT